MKRRKDIDIFTFSKVMVDAKSIKIVGWKFIKKSIENGDNVTVRGDCTVHEFQLFCKKYMNGENCKKEFRKAWLFANK